MAIPAEVQKAVDELLKSEQAPVLQTVQRLFQCLQDAGLRYTQPVLPKDTLAHPSNRGGAMLNPTDVWSKGLRMMAIGVQPALLQQGGVAFEVSTDKSAREEQFAANERLVAASEGALAPVSRQERFLTVATSHSAAFIKAVAMGCKSMDGNTVDLQQDSGLQQLVNSGWPMTVLSEVVEKQWPALPAFVQLAMNSVNPGFKQINEIECASLLSEFMKHGLTFDQAMQKVHQSDPACKPQLSAIGYFVARYGGGSQQGLIHFLKEFSTLPPNN